MLALITKSSPLAIYYILWVFRFPRLAGMLPLRLFLPRFLAKRRTSNKNRKIWCRTHMLFQVCVGVWHLLRCTKHSLATPCSALSIIAALNCTYNKVKDFKLPRLADIVPLRQLSASVLTQQSEGGQWNAARYGDTCRCVFCGTRQMTKLSRDER